MANPYGASRHLKLLSASCPVQSFLAWQHESLAEGECLEIQIANQMLQQSRWFRMCAASHGRRDRAFTALTRSETYISFNAARLI